MPTRTRTRLPRRTGSGIPGGFAPNEVYKWFTGWKDSIPDIIEFVTSDAYLDRGQILYPRQATFLKIIFLQDELFTDYDYDVIEEWANNYSSTADEKGEGNNGIVPDILDRIRINKAAGRKWFRESVVPIGRRGGKGHVGALSGAYVLWHYLACGDPQNEYGIDRDKKLQMLVFAGKKDQAKANQWGDLDKIIRGAPCFGPYISQSTTERLSVFAPHDFARIYDQNTREIESTADPATFEILPKESTVMSARGPAVFAQFYDEEAHVVKSVAKNDASEVWESAIPSLDQFGKDAFVYEPSSPWTRIGQFYTNYCKAIAKEADGSPTYPEVLVLQLTSWEPYLDWERAHTLEARPATLTKEPIVFQPLRRAVQTYDHEMQQLERANPETFAVERRALFAAVLNAYLNPVQIARIWQPWNGRTMVTQSSGKLGILYRAHGDPSKSNANFGFAIGHLEDPHKLLPPPPTNGNGNGHGPIEIGPFADFVAVNQMPPESQDGQSEEKKKIRVSDLPHVVFDVITAWLPADFPGHQIDYDYIEEQCEGFIDAFMPTELSFDQWNSVSSIQHLQKYVYEKTFPKPITIYERDATEPLNWKTYETFKTALGLGLVHGPFNELADQELTYLQDLGHRKVDHPTAGPVQTKDVADCLAIVTHSLLGDTLAAFIGQALATLPLVGTQQGGMATHQQEANPATQQTHEALSNFGRNMNPARGRAAGRGYVPRRRRR